jgi:2'-hydroxyisoflavone reductase
MRALVAGGTRFIGRHLVELLLADGHEVTLFNRGRTNPHLFPAAARIAGERSDPPAALGARDWDWVFDVSAYTAADLLALGRLVAPRTGRYVLVSTGSVYRDRAGTPNVDEDGELWPTTPEFTAEGSPSAYGARKAAAEAALRGLGVPWTVVRPVLVYGPWDTSDRCHYWLHRVRMGRVVVPEPPAGINHSVYVKDLARILVAAAKAPHAAGRAYNGASTVHHTLMDWIAAASRVSGVTPEVRALPWADLPGPLPIVGPGGERSVSTQRIQRDFGFTSTPFEATIAESYAHMDAEGRPIREWIPSD